MGLSITTPHQSCVNSLPYAASIRLEMHHAWPPIYVCRPVANFTAGASKCAKRKYAVADGMPQGLGPLESVEKL